MTGLFRSIVQYRGFIYGNIKREFQTKYQNSLLGAAWNIINPLSMIVVYTLIFSQIMRAKLPGVDSAFAYSIYLCAGTFTWNIFNEIVSRSQNVFIENANIIKKINFPRICLPVTLICNALVNFGIIFFLFTIFLILSGSFPGFVYFEIFPVLAVAIIFAIGLGMVVGVLNVFFRDVGQTVTIFMQFWFWFTPIVYPVNIIPERFQELVKLNPMAAIIEGSHNILVQGKSPDWPSLLPSLIIGILLMGLGMRLFRKNVGEMVDEL
ncbi:ABC transporter permease [Pantoea vagans]|jgi:lipopolysaccharide transport system permease protein|uniref:ABC transporter permease n=1 Tax=Pantoea vagans TaxID=470934 RepID=UPI0028A24B9B|nr:ABC transporter permease [Pantoea vagans]